MTTEQTLPITAMLEKDIKELGKINNELYTCWEYGQQIENEKIGNEARIDFARKILPQVRIIEEVQQKKVKELQHFKDTSVGLWCTDKPEAIPEDKKHLFFQLK